VKALSRGGFGRRLRTLSHPTISVGPVVPRTSVTYFVSEINRLARIVDWLALPAIAFATRRISK
jgi:hypothetical protein